jgi:hypothetical protein
MFNKHSLIVARGVSNVYSKMKRLSNGVKWLCGARMRRGLSSSGARGMYYRPPLINRLAQYLEHAEIIVGPVTGASKRGGHIDSLNRSVCSTHAVIMKR